MGCSVRVIFSNPGNYVSRGFVSCKKNNVSFVVPDASDGRNLMYIPSTDAD